MGREDNTDGKSRRRDKTRTFEKVIEKHCFMFLNMYINSLKGVLPLGVIMLS